MARLLPVIEALDPLPVRATSSFAAQYVKMLREVPDILPLTLMPNSIFNRNLPIEALSHFNRDLGAGLGATGRD